MIDALTLSQTKETLYNGLGYVELIDCMPRLVPDGRTCEFAIARNARMSTGNGIKTIEQDQKLITRLYNDKHTSPFETVSFTFEMIIPIFVQRQVIRHRTAKVNELSGRYSELPASYYLPSVRLQCGANHQMSSVQPVSKELTDLWNESDSMMRSLFEHYQKLVGAGVAREVARTILPVATMTKLSWTMDLHNLLHFLKLRTAPDAQLEIQQLATAIQQIIKPLIPTIDALYRS